MDGKLSEALSLAEQAERLFPDSARIMDAVEEVREFGAAQPPPSGS